MILIAEIWRYTKSFVSAWDRGTEQSIELGLNLQQAKEYPRPGLKLKNSNASKRQRVPGRMLLAR
jgi:hypothetical protein